MKLHSDDCNNWLLEFLLENPKTHYEDATLLSAFSQLFPNIVLVDRLEALYREGILSKFAGEAYYLPDPALKKINLHGKAISHSIVSEHKPVWDRS